MLDTMPAANQEALKNELREELEAVRDRARSASHTIGLMSWGGPLSPMVQTLDATRADVLPLAEKLEALLDLADELEAKAETTAPETTASGRAYVTSSRMIRRVLKETTK